MDDDKTDSQKIDEPDQPESTGEPTEETKDVKEEVKEEPKEEPTEEPVEEPEPEQTEEQGEEEAPAAPSRRENLRIQQLIRQLKRNDPAPTPKKAEAPDAIDYRETLTADDEVYKTLETDRQSYGKQQYNQGISEAQKLADSTLFRTRLEIDAPKVEGKYPQLDKDSKEFHPALANTINEWFLATSGYQQDGSVTNPNIRYGDFVEGVMEIAEEIAGEKVKTTSRNITKQTAQTALRPDGSKAKSLNLNKMPQDMSDEELEAAIKATLR